MIRKRSARALAGGLATILLLVAASAAYAAVSGKFSGTTKQKLAISFHVGNGQLTNMRFGVLLKCPSGHTYIGHDKVLGAIKINAKHRFDKKLASTTSPTTDELEVSGTVFSKKVTGKLTEHLQIKKEKNAICVAHTSYIAHKQ